MLASTLYYGPARRQAVFMVLASFDWLGQGEVANRLRVAASIIDVAGKIDAASIGRSIMVLRRPRDLIRALFGTVPDGLVGTMQRLGHDPAGDPTTYMELQRLYFSRASDDKRRVKTLGQMTGELVGAQIEVVSMLDPVLLHPSFVASIREAKQVAELNAALSYIRARCSTATDEAVRASLSRLKPGEHRSILFRWWAHRFDRLPRTFDTRGDPTIVMLGTAEDLVSVSRRYGNCLQSKIGEVFVGNYVYAEYRPEAPEPGVIAELRVTTHGFFLEGLYAAKNRKVRAERAATVRQKLAACGVALLDHAPDQPETVAAAAQVLGLYNFAEPDNTGWGVEYDDPPANDLDELENALSEVA
ncbi:hypothetical protein [Methylobacterium sp. Leaf118]|uniref:hypothetical protein n=1 Tax=Methylobacterium sp. Leaf118 TaxID=2876562 RepID=UPI001E50AC67|nr:hypothetical protein [Methylobacterium sp. Leaf118]